MWPRRFASCVRTGLTWPAAWNRVREKRITSCCASLSRKCGARNESSFVEGIFAGNHGDNRSVDGHGTGTLRSLRGALRSGDAHGTVVRTGAGVRKGKVGRLVSNTVPKFAKELCGASYAAAIRFASDGKAGRATDLFEARRFASHRRAQNQQRYRAGAAGGKNGQAAHHCRD